MSTSHLWLETNAGLQYICSSILYQTHIIQCTCINIYSTNQICAVFAWVCLFCSLLHSTASASPNRGLLCTSHCCLLASPAVSTTLQNGPGYGLPGLLAQLCQPHFRMGKAMACQACYPSCINHTSEWGRLWLARLAIPAYQPHFRMGQAMACQACLPSCGNHTSEWGMLWLARLLFQYPGNFLSGDMWLRIIRGPA